MSWITSTRSSRHCKHVSSMTSCKDDCNICSDWPPQYMHLTQASIFFGRETDAFTMLASSVIRDATSVPENNIQHMAACKFCGSMGSVSQSSIGCGES